MRRLTRAFALILTAVIFFQCQRELSHIGGPDPVPVLPDPITAIVQGNVLDENGQAAAGVNVKVGSQTAITDARGYFRVKNAALDKNASLVTAEKNGYFKAYRTFNATSATNQVVIKLIKKTLAGTINGAAGGEATLTNGMKISLPANGVVVASSGAAHANTVNVYASFIDPTASDIGQTVPGSFMADDKNGGRVTLSSYGMMAVELESAAGEKLQIKSGSKATLTNPIPSSLQSSAPATIALWYVDETTGIWKEEGSATKNGNNYTGDVSHFSFWNCDISIPAITLSLTLKNTDGAPLVHALVRVSRTSPNPTATYGYTDSLGQVSGLVPANQNLVLDVLDQCHTSIYNQNIGPYNQNTNLGTITITGPGASSVVTVKGKLLNCSGNPVTNGFAMIVYDNTVRYDAVDANGDFATNFTRCSGGSNNVQVLGVDETAQQQGNAVTVAITTPITNAGNISACGTSSAQYINYTLDGTNYIIDNSNDSLMAWTSGQGSTPVQFITSFSGFQNATVGNNISFTFHHTTALIPPGTYPMASLSVQNFNQTVLGSASNIVITNFPASVGQFYEGTFSGTFTAASATHTFSGSFRVRKNF